MKIPWRRAKQPTPGFLPGESPRTEETGGILSMVSQRAGDDWATKHRISRFRGTSVCICLWPHWPQHTRPPCPSSAPGDCSNSCPSSQWCHPTISSSAPPSSSCLQPFPASGFFPMSQLIGSGGQNIGASASASVLQWILRMISFRINCLDSLALQGTLKSLLHHHGSKHQAKHIWFKNGEICFLLGIKLLYC